MTEDSRPRSLGVLPDRQTVWQIPIAGQGLRANVLSYGATLQSLYIAGHPKSLVLGLDDLEGYLNQAIYLGATVGRCANRIAEGRFSIDGTDHQTDQNFLNRHTLHGGACGTSRLNWQVLDHHPDRVTLGMDLADGQMGFPGAMEVRLTFSITAGPALSLEITAQADKPTLCNFAHHGYFNLGLTEDVTDHLLHIPAGSYQRPDDTLIPENDPVPLAGTALDFRVAKRLRAALRDGGIDHNFCFEHQQGQALLAQLSAPDSGVRMAIHSTEPGLQVYDGELTDLVREGTRNWNSYAGIALEPQNWPNAINNPKAPSPILRPGEVYRQRTSFVFSTRR
ncbi:aldose epimerase family protein [Sulfitobacter sp. M368]|uniref:aldose epimerase family protein n=1 Tax=Sulfitobacter sp. M368 TaxID=2867021 RepID=UPI0021A31459|nr:aldose epimerase family protein [Sulfitobacter sp. M368]UWR14734.1 galactose mutarotase [Sulfitobacter sp. M368]